MVGASLGGAGARKRRQTVSGQHGPGPPAGLHYSD